MNPFLLLALIGGGIFLASKYMGSSSSSSAPSFDALLKEFEASPGLQTSVRNMIGKGAGGVTVDSLKAQWAASDRAAFDNASYELGAGALMPWPTKSAGDDAARAWLLKMGSAFYEKGRPLGTDNLDGKRPGLVIWSAAAADENVRWLTLAQRINAAMKAAMPAGGTKTESEKVREGVDEWLDPSPATHIEMAKALAVLAKAPGGTDAVLSELLALEKKRAGRLGATQAELDAIVI